MVSRLSKNDSSVLSALFDPELSLSSNIQIDEDSSPSASPAKVDLHAKEHLALRSINKEHPTVQEIQQSIFLLNDLIESNPSYASAWNNRAQARRMLVTDKELRQNPTLVVNIFEDLAQAISLATPANESQAVVGANAQVLSAAHTHRGYLLFLASKSEESQRILMGVPGLQNASKESLEESASREFALGGRYGNDTARQLAVKTNPYAKLCGSIVREAMTKEITDFYQSQLNLVG